MKNLEKRRLSSLAGMLSIALDSFSDSQNFFHAFKSLLVLYLAGMLSIALDSFSDSQNFFHAFKSLLVLY